MTATDHRPETIDRSRAPFTREAGCGLGVGRWGHVHGYTLIELMAVSAVIAVLGGGFVSVLVTAQGLYFSGDANLQVQQEARKALDAMVRELREAGAEPPGQISATTSQLNFQIARGYNAESGCQNPARVCWGSERATGEWVHYAIIGPSGNDRQLVRCTNGSSSGGVTGSSGCTSYRVLANKVRHPNSAGTAAFSVAVNLVTVNLEVEYRSPKLAGGTSSSAGGSRTTGPLTASVRLRNSS